MAVMYLFLDVIKAFDRADCLILLFQKLINHNIPGYIVPILLN